MPKNKKYLPLIILLLIVAVIGFFIVLNTKKETSTEMILFYGNTCPHCKKVNDYINANNVKAKFDFQELEVYNNQVNARLMAKKAVACGIDTNQGLSIPFFFDGKNCLIGDEKIINYFQN